MWFDIFIIYHFVENHSVKSCCILLCSEHPWGMCNYKYALSHFNQYLNYVPFQYICRYMSNCRVYWHEIFFIFIIMVSLLLNWFMLVYFILKILLSLKDIVLYAAQHYTICCLHMMTSKHGVVLCNVYLFRKLIYNDIRQLIMKHKVIMSVLVFLLLF